MFSLVLILLVVFVVLSLLLAAWTLFFQGYIYSEPVEAIYWRAPAAGAALTLFLAFWTVLDYRSIETPTDEEGRYRPLHELSVRETEIYDKLTILTQDRKKVSFTRQGRQYLSKGGRPLPERPLEIIATDKEGQEHVFKPKTDEKGRFKVEDNGRLRYYEEGNPKRYMDEDYLGQITIYHFGWLMTGLMLNFGLLVVWFLCLWLLLRFQWAHALGLAFAAWLINLFVLPLLLTQAENVRKANLPPPQTVAMVRSCPAVTSPLGREPSASGGGRCVCSLLSCWGGRCVCSLLSCWGGRCVCSLLSCWGGRCVCSLPPCGGGLGWGGELLSLQALLPLTPALPHKGGGRESPFGALT